MTRRSEILALLAEPTVAYLVVIAGGLLVAAECLRPGRVLPGVAGAVLITTAMYRLIQLQWSTLGTVLLTASVAFLISGVFTQSHISHLLVAISCGAASLVLIPGDGIHPVAAVFGAGFVYVLSWLLAIAYRARLSKRGAECHR